MRRKFLLILAVFITLTSLSACRIDAEPLDKLKIALPSNTSFVGIFNLCYADDLLDSEIAYWINEPLLLLGTGEDITYTQDGAASYEYDREAKTVTLTMKPGVKWHDGQPVTMEDLAFAYEVMAHPDYEGYFYTETMSYITGMEDYHQGLADNVAGLELSEDKQTLTMRFDEFRPSILEGGIWSYPLPKHYLGGVPVAEMAAHPRSRHETLGFGPFKIETVVPGETVDLVRFDDYWQGTPKIDGVTLSIVNPEIVPQAMENGLYDVCSFPTDMYEDYTEPENYSYKPIPDKWYQFTGFRIGHFDPETGENITEPDAKMNNQNLRLAIGYAVDIQSICDEFYNGLRGINPSILPPQYDIYRSPEVTGFTYDPEKAGALLDEAGYADADGDGFRENPDGSPLVINWAVPNGNPETVTMFKIQCWNDVGLDVRLLTGTTLDANVFYDMLFADSPELDMFESGWLIEESPNLPNAWGRYSVPNFTRFASEELDELLADIDSEEAWDKEYRIQAYHRLTEYFFEQSPAVPTVWRTNLYAINNRVKNYTGLPVQNSIERHLIELDPLGPNE